MSGRVQFKRLFLVVTLLSLTVVPLTAFCDTATEVIIPKPTKSDRCPVCGMFVYRYPKWIAGFVFNSGAKYFHCSPKCMLHNLNHVSKYQPKEKRENLRLIWVTEYYGTQRMNAQDVLFVTGTSLIGPMGLDLIPVRGKEAAEALKTDYRGESILTLDRITPEVIEKARKARFHQGKRK